MVFFIMFLIIAVGGFIYLIWDMFDSAPGKIIAYIVGSPLAVVFSVFLSAILTLFVSFCGFLLPSVDYNSAPEAIYGLEDNVGEQGKDRKSVV